MVPYAGKPIAKTKVVTRSAFGCRYNGRMTHRQNELVKSVCARIGCSRHDCLEAYIIARAICEPDGDWPSKVAELATAALADPVVFALLMYPLYQLIPYIHPEE
jgi:hypothetical protein